MAKQAKRASNRRARPSSRGAAGESDLTPAQVRELERRVEDLHDPTRYVLTSSLTTGIVFYYNLSEDTYGWNDPMHATLFKRRAAAVAIRKHLGGGVTVVPCRVDRKGQLIRKSIAPIRAKRSR